MIHLATVIEQGLDVWPWLPTSLTTSRHGSSLFFFLIKNVLLLLSYINENTTQNLLDVVNTEITDNRKFIATNAYI